jgi:gliding motility-associated-like protein
MNKTLLLFLILFMFYGSLFCQHCPNTDFSHVNFDFWTGYIGNNNGFSYGCCPIPGIVPGRHTLITSPMTDPNTCGNLVVPPPGYTVCARLGDANAGAGAERLVYELVVDPANPIFFYTFAAVLGDPHCAMQDQPRFAVKLIDSAYTYIDTVCGLYDVYSDSTLPGFHSCTLSPTFQVNWRDWSTVGINLTSLAGHRLRVMFSTYDCHCLPEHHFGYAYITAACGNFIIDQTVCAGSPDLVLTAPPGYTYLWNTGDTTQSIILQNPLLGTTYQCQLTGVTGCTYNISTTIGLNMFTVLYPGFTYTHDPCSRSFSFFNTTSVNTGSPFASHWDFGDGTTSNLHKPTHTFSAPGLYTVSLTITTLGGCDTTISQTIDVSHLPQALFSAADTCQPFAIPFQNFSVAQDSIASWKWDFGDGSTPDTLHWEPIHTYALPGTYWVNLWVTDTNGCSDSVTHKVIVYGNLFAKFKHSLFNCGDSTTTITFNGSAYTSTAFSWDFGGGTVLSGSGPGPYVIHWPGLGSYEVSLLLDGPFCDTTSYTDTIHAFPSTIAEAGNDTTICKGQQVLLQASGGIYYLWSPADGLNDVSISNPVASPSATTSYTVSVTDSNSCSNTDQVTITVIDPPAASFNVDHNPCCLEDSLYVEYSGNASPAALYSWLFPGAIILSGSGQGPFTLSWPSPGIYPITLTVAENNCYSHTNLLNIHVEKVEALISSYQEASCYGYHDGSATSYASGGIPPYSFLWSNAQAGALLDSVAAGTYILTVTDSAGCQGTDTLILTSPSPYDVTTAIINARCEYSCDGELAVLVSGGTRPYSYLWNTFPSQDTSSLAGLCPGDYKVTVSDDHQCDTTLTLQLIYSTDILAGGIADITSGTVPLSVNFTFTGYGANSIAWDFGDNSTSALLNPSHTFTSVGDFETTLIINSLEPDYCLDTSLITIRVEDTSSIQVPNVFTPNNDGYNDYFEINNHYINEYSISLFNRWGVLIFTSRDAAVHWDGKTHEGNPVPEGTYIYVLEARGKDGKKMKRQGAVTLLR